VPYQVTVGPDVRKVGLEHEGAGQTLPNLGALLQVLDTPEVEVR
jgi:hypothetical protein